MRSIPATVALAVLLAGCGAGAGASDPPEVTDTPTRSRLADPPARPTTTATIPSPSPTPDEPLEITLAFAGDIHFEDDIRPRLSDPASALETIRDALSAADLTIANLETAVTTRGRPEPKTYTFRAPPSAFEALASGGIDVATMANNHGVDFGAVGLTDSLAAAEDSPIPVVGIGRDAAAAFAPAVADVRGVKVAVLGATQVADHTARSWAAGPDKPGVAVIAESADRLVRAVKEARRQADVVVVYLHYGEERVGCPTSPQQRVVRQLVDAGADVIVGSHAHILLGAGWLKNTYVSYGLGNFVWYHPNSTREATTGVLSVRIKDGKVVADEFTPAFIRQDGLPRIRTAEKARSAEAAWRKLRDCTGLAAQPG